MRNWLGAPQDRSGPEALFPDKDCSKSIQVFTVNATMNTHNRILHA